MDANKRARDASSRTPMRTPGKNDFKRPAFALGRISFGSSSSSEAESPLENGHDFEPQRAAPAAAFRLPAAPAPPCAVATSSEPLPSRADPNILADRSLRNNEAHDAEHGKRPARFSSSSSAVSEAGSFGNNRRPAAAPSKCKGLFDFQVPAYRRPRQKEQEEEQEGRGSSAVASGGRGRFAVDLSTDDDQENVAPEGETSGRRAPEGGGGGGAVTAAAAGSGTGASVAASSCTEEASWHSSPPRLGCEERPSSCGLFGGEFDSDDLLDGGVYVYSPSPPPAAPAAGSSAGAPSLASEGRGSSPARSQVVDLSYSSPPSAPLSGARAGRELSHRSGGLASTSRTSEEKISDGHACFDADDHNIDAFADCVDVSENDLEGFHDSYNLHNTSSGSSSMPHRNTPGASFSTPSSRGGGGSRNSGGASRYSGKRLSSRGSGAGAHYEVNAEEDATGEGSDVDVAMIVAAKPSAQGAGAGAGYRSTGASGRAVTAGAGAGGRYFKPGETGDWEREPGGSCWKMEAEGPAGGSVSAAGSGLGSGSARKGRRGLVAFSVPGELYKRMYPHQRTGIRWMWGLHQGDMGGILGDDMGLGKTFQVTCFLAGLFSTDQAGSALVLAPKSVMRGWETELKRWLVRATCPLAEVVVLVSEMSAKARRKAILEAADGGALGRGAVLVTTYGMVSANPHHFAPRGAEHKWDYVVLDEGHKIKNSCTRTCKAVHAIPARRRLLLTGTPVQNNLKELHTVVDWVTFGGLLGPYPDFKKYFSKPIESGQDRDASEKLVQRSRARAAELRESLEPFLIQRTKGEIIDEKATTKTEMVVWVALSPKQREIYAAYLGGESVKDVLSGKVSSPLAAIQHLKKVTLHPLVSSYPLDQPWDLDPEEPVEKLLQDSCKLEVMLKMVVDACENGHRVLVFSRFVRMLDIIERCLAARKSEGGAGLRLARIDGSHSDLERQDTIATFNRNERISVCLVSTGAGGTGITLTGADRVILFDPSWNPADDMQAVDRAYRIGQTRDVVVYRMIAAGTVEEKMYEKQVFKDGLRRTIMGGNGKRKKNVRYFSRAELKQLFTLFPPAVCRVLVQLEEMHGSLQARLEAAESQAQRELALDGHLDFMHDLVGCYGASAHGDGLPKITQHDSAGTAGGNAVSVPAGSIEEEEDESDVEDMSDDGMPGSREGRRGRGRGMQELLEIDFCDLEGDFPRITAGDGKRRGVVRKSRRFSGGGKYDDAFVIEDTQGPRGTGGSASTSVGDPKEDGGEEHKRWAGAAEKGDDSLEGVDKSTAIALSDDSDSEAECDFGDAGGKSSSPALDATPGNNRIEEVKIYDNDVIDLLDGEDGFSLPASPPPATDAVSDTKNDTFLGCVGTPESWGMSPLAPVLLPSPAPSGKRLTSLAASSTPASEGGGECFGARGYEPSAPDSFSRLAGGDDDQEEHDEVKLKGSVQEDSGSLRSTPPALPASAARINRGKDGFGFSLEGAEKKSAGRKRARRWARNTLGVSPIASPSSGGDSNACRGGDDEHGRREADIKAARVAAARERAMKFAKGELGMESVGRGSSSGAESEETLGAQDEDDEGNCGEVNEPPSGARGEVNGLEKEGSRREKLSQEMPTVVGRDLLESDDGKDEEGSDSSGKTVEYPPSSASQEAETSLNSRWNSPPRSFACSAESIATSLDVRHADLTAPSPPGTLPIDGAAVRRIGGREQGGERRPSTLVNHDVEREGTPMHLCENDCSSSLFSTPEKAGGGEWAGSQSVCTAAGPRSDRSSYETAGSVVDVRDGNASTPTRNARGGRNESLVYLDRRQVDGNGAGVSATSRSQEGPHERWDGGEREEEGEDDAHIAETSPVEGKRRATESTPAVPSPAPLARIDSSPTSVCAAHKAIAERGGYKCLRCRCGAGAEDAEEAQVLLLKAWEEERAGNLYGAMGVCLQAIKLCDEDKELHKTIARIGSRMGCLT